MKTNFKIIAISVVVLLSTSCSMNKIFLRPTKFKNNLEKLVVNKTATDSMTITYSGANHQPTFLDKNNEPVILDYTVESIMFKTANAYSLNAWMLKPKSQTPKATLIYFHGNGNNLLYQIQFILPMVKRGYQVFAVDYRGYGFSEGKATINNLLVDGYNTVDYALTREDIKGAPVFIYGQSFGGNLAICVGAKKQNVVDGIISEGTFNSHEDLAAKDFKAKSMVKLFVKENYCSQDLVTQIKKPLLIAHSPEDETIPFSMSEVIYKNATAEHKEFIKISGKHLKASASDFDKIDSAIMKMIK